MNTFILINYVLNDLIKIVLKNEITVKVLVLMT